MSLGRTAVLRNGAKIPLVGLGTWQSEPGKVTLAVKTALNAGYRHIDAAWIYENEKEVGLGLKESGVPRDQIFLTTKLWNTFHKPEEVVTAFEESLNHLGVDYVDLYLIHWPFSFKKEKGANGENLLEDVPIKDTWQAMEKLVDSGKAKAIGISNFNIPRIQQLLDTNPRILPAVNQVELQPYNSQEKLLEFCTQKGIHLTAYSPLGSTGSPLAKEPVVEEIAKKHGKTGTNVLISWAAQRGTSVIPKSVTPERIIENFQDFVLSDEEMQKLNELGKSKQVRYCDPKNFWGLPCFEDDAKQ